jgi:hypothetical protein
MKACFRDNRRKLPSIIAQHKSLNRIKRTNANFSASAMANQFRVGRELIDIERPKTTFLRRIRAKL